MHFQAETEGVWGLGQLCFLLSYRTHPTFFGVKHNLHGTETDLQEPSLATSAAGSKPTWCFLSVLFKSCQAKSHPGSAQNFPKVKGDEAA